jgi:hypothetical protein
MNRPRYETAEDLNHEFTIATEWAAQWNATIQKLPEGKRYFCDMGVFRDGNMVAIAEVKDRPAWKPSYGTVILGLSKVRDLYSYNKLSIPAYFVARLAGVIHYTRIDDRIADWHIHWSGRTDRNDPQDLEPCVHIPFEAFV